jgi:hypothetical protein
LTAVQQEQSLQAISEIKVQPGEGGSFIVSLRVLGGWFAPLSLNGMQTELFVALRRDVEITLRGTLEFIPTNEAHGTWFPFVFLSKVTHRGTRPLASVRFSGPQNMWSNIKAFRFRVGTIERHFANRFFRLLPNPSFQESR